MSLFAKHDPVGSTDTGLHIEDVRSDVPKFERVYTKQLDNRAHLKVSIKTFIGSRFKHAELTQPNGRWVLFDVDDIADKILDPPLVPILQKCCDEILRLDEAFMNSDPGEYIDERGAVWKRQR